MRKLVARLTARVEEPGPLCREERGQTMAEYGVLLRSSRLRSSAP